MNKLRAYLAGKNLYSIFLHLVAVVLAVEVVILARQNKELKQGPAALQQESLKVGDYFSLSGVVRLGSGARLDSTSTRQVICVFTTQCPFCKETLPFWERIEDQAKRARDVALIGICLDDEAPTKAYVEEHSLTFPVFVAIDKDSLVKKNKLHGVPQTIIRSRGGRVQRVWRGRLSEEQFQEVAKAMSDTATDKHSHVHIQGGVR
jgi:peroxiredoxin